MGVLLKAIRYVIIGFYIGGIFAIGTILSLLNLGHPNNMSRVAHMLPWKGFQILGLTIDNRHQEYLTDLGPAVYMSNHQSNFDIFPGGATVQKNTVLLGKTAIKWIPFFGAFFWASGNIFVDRSNPIRAKESMKNLTKKITEDKLSIWVMPEGTRDHGKELLPFKKGAFITAINAQVPIAPIVFSSFSVNMKLNEWHAGKIITETLKPIPTKGMTLKDLDSLMKNVYDQMAAKLKLLDQEAYS